MDAGALRECIASTLSANADIRRQAELQLKSAEVQNGFVAALTDLISSDPDVNLRLSAVVYLKNKVTRSWESNDEYPKVPAIPEEEKAILRDRLIPTLATAPTNIRQQLVPLISKILHYDFPERWPQYMDITMNLLNSNDIQSVYAGVQCLLSICRTYRFKRDTDKREELDRVTQATFPIILNIGNKLVDETSAEAGDMLKMIIKTYKHAVYFELAAHLREQSSIVAWCQLFIRVVQKEAPAESMLEDIDEREIHPWWKAKKWAYGNLNRLFVRYGNPGAVTSGANGESYEEFAKGFIETFAPEILKAYLSQIELWVSKQRWLSKICQSNIIAFMDECIKPSATWKYLSPHVETLIQHVLFPLLCQSDEDLELFHDEPAEYIHRKINLYEEISSPDVAATNFLMTLTKSRKKQTFTVLNFINGVVNRYETASEQEKNHREKEGALRMIGTLASIILGKKSPIADQVEYFFVRHVFPEFRSSQGFLRARACDVLEKFSELDFQDENNIVLIYQNIVQCLNDPELPVKVEAALALQPLIRHDFIRTSMKQNIADIMQQLLKLANEVDVDSLATVMEEFVEVFAAELTPFAVQLTEQLRDTYLRIISDVIEKGQGNNDDDDIDNYLDDKSITALGVLQTIGTLILTLESTPNVLLHLEQILVPVITITLEHKLSELYNEVFEIIDSCTFSAKAISPTMWGIFTLIHRSFKDRAEIFIEEMLPCLDNYVSYGHEQLKANPEYMEAIFDIITTIFTNERLGPMDRICGCKLAEAVLLNMRGHADKYLNHFIEIAMSCLTDNADIKSYRVHLLEMVINCIYYNPAATLQILESHGWTNKFFSLWFSNIENFNRVHDKKLSIVAIVALIQLSPEQVPLSIQPGWVKLMSGIVSLFHTLPLAMKNREEMSKESLNFDEEFGSDSENEWDGDNNWDKEGEEGDEVDIPDESAAYLDFLNQSSNGNFNLDDFDDEDESLEEETLLETPLDLIEPYQLFRGAMLNIQATQPAVYDALTKELSPEEQGMISSVFQEAEQKRLEQEAAAIAAMQAQQAGN
ncbi:armadillo-type protein [Pyronema domesticum]|uniref:Similar to Probable importin c550.11 acc. no. O59809 n=1 Tax=Pyronema omphalodes (strain CBS 100304) TaxID=1076935 RepID=U4KW18_PYROM|nr:armadillo-type protein [Pyronema domesticum]CCX05231.1 Similar to Probable importin c550.11; acc. no. O59809 [Pyronema omphalodes CBS 100304]